MPEPPARVFTATLYDRYQPQSLSFVFVPASSLGGGQVPRLEDLWRKLGDDAPFRREISASLLPAALASLLETTPTPFAWVDQIPQGELPVGPPITVRPQSLGFAEYVAYSESVPFEQSPLGAKSLVAIATLGANIGLLAGGIGTPLVFVTVPAGIILCTAAAVIGPELGAKITQLIM